MLSSGANAIIWDEMISSGASVIMLQSGATVIIWCYRVMLSSGMITPPFFIFPENFTHSLRGPILSAQAGHQLSIYCIKELFGRNSPHLASELVFLNVYGAPELIPRNVAWRAGTITLFLLRA